MQPHMLRATAIAGALLLSTSFAQLSYAKPTFHPNSQKYQDSRPNAKGRSGSASLEARALLNRDGSVDIDATTSTFDSATARGTISKVQLDLETGATRNFNHLDNGGTFTTNVDGLMRGDTVSLQANVSGINGARTGIVDVDTTVRYRPDLAVGGITPTVAVRGEETLVRATITELNGDTGARADCRLLVDGIQVDRAEGIWVDADGSVQCVFVTEFATAGIANVTVIADNMNPGDWDDANNSATIQLQVQDPAESFYSWTISARQDEFDRLTWNQRSWEERTTHNTGIEQNFQVNARLRDVPMSTGPMSMRVVVRTSGVTFFDQTSTDFEAPFTRRRNTCRTSFSYPEVAVCLNADSGLTSIDTHFGMADAVYRSWGWATRRDPWAPEEPRFEWNEVRVTTGAVPFGNSVDFDLTFETSGRRFVAHPSITSFTESVRIDNRPYTCAEDDFTGETVCFWWETWSRELRGNVFGF